MNMSVVVSVMRVGALSTLLGLSGCGYYASRIAHKAQQTMIGMTEEDMQACAGIPTKTQKVNDHVTIAEYQRGRNIETSSGSTLIPVEPIVNIVKDIGGGAGNSCVADFRLVDGKVHDVYYSGDNDMLVGTDGVCSTIIRGCVRRSVPTESSTKGWVSAFRQPQPDTTATPAVTAPTDTTPTATPAATGSTAASVAPQKK